MTDDDRVRMRVKRGTWEFEVEGPRNYVEEQIARAKAEMEATPEVAALGEPSSSAAVDRGRSIRLKDFVASKAPRSHIESAATIAVWAKDNAGVPAVGGTELDRLYKEAELKRPADALHILQRAASERSWFELAGEGKYRLTPAGEDFVEYDLPKKKPA
jgi:hypothetical protein